MSSSTCSLEDIHWFWFIRCPTVHIDCGNRLFRGRLKSPLEPFVPIHIGTGLIPDWCPPIGRIGRKTSPDREALGLSRIAAGRGVEVDRIVLPRSDMMNLDGRSAVDEDRTLFWVSALWSRLPLPLNSLNGL